MYSKNVCWVALSFDEFTHDFTFIRYRLNHSLTAEAIAKAYYSDRDYLDSVDFIDEAVKLVQGGLEFRNFSSNSNEVLQRLGETKHVEKKSPIQDKIVDTKDALGMMWIPIVEVFIFDNTIRDNFVNLLVEGGAGVKACNVAV